MIYHVVTQSVKPGKMDEARALLLDYAAHVMKTYPGQKVQIVSNIGEPANQLHWVNIRETVEGEAIKQDPENLKKMNEFMAKSAEIFESARVEHYYRDVE
ncbi:MAG: hypothetical protein R3C14_34315 [Caldilineaceae bacterium]